ncbi:MAG: hypothetical protein Q4Q07_09160 [Tissierellia bacterium]|nr:hypothetical protein [Tissierellia bacterium]
MRQKDFTERARKEKLTDLYIRYDNGFSDCTDIIGCTQIENLWYIYETDEKGNKIIRMISDDEEKTFDTFYEFILKRKDSRNCLAVS